MKPDLATVPAFYHGYIKKIKQDDLRTAFGENSKELFAYLEAIPQEKISYSYAQGKWTVRQAVQHMIDAERVFVYRALRFSRADQTPLPGFDENAFADHADAAHIKWEDLLEEFRLLRRSTELFFAGLTDEQLHRVGIASEQSCSALAFGFITVGHAAHHLDIFKERYFGEMPTSRIGDI
ncbi:DinB family protein [Nostoc ellipsosporum NOK]|nr:DinB family protein [Nostoc ellipsosporum NOK]